MNPNHRFVILLSMAVTLLGLAGYGSAEPAAKMISATEPPIAVDTTAATDTPGPADTPLLTDTPIPTEPPPPPTDKPEPQLEDRTWPTKRESFAMAYDPESERVLIFCGYDEFVSGHAWQHEMVLKARDEWAYDAAQDRLELLRLQPYTIYNQAV